ncbi:MAG TPA: carboxypeptidase regulatory-like domain-containing protein [Blastocatellia bacterium]|nr:carboxypeptidase regulatory-like domain-containing protein [Blastocatellia bacterium]
MSRWQTCLLLGFFLLGFAPPTYGQSSRGAISGLTVDPTGAVVPQVKIVARNVATGVTAEAQSTNDGNYRLPELPSGIYTLTATANGFKTAERTDVKVEVNTTLALDITLEPGAVTDTVSVVADAPTVQAETSEVGTVVRPRQVLELPLIVNGVGGLRSPEAFTFLVPGVVGPGTATDAGVRNDGAGENGGAFQSKFTGSQNFSNEVLVDGASMFRSENGSSFDETAMSVEAVQEFKVQTSTIPAEFGRTGGGITSFAIRTGSNDWHGNVYDFFRNRVLNANRFFNNARRLPRPLDNFHNYGATIGGPVYLPRFGEGGSPVISGKNRTFFFFAYEGFRRNAAGAQTNTLPTAAFRNGDFSSLLTTTQIGTDALGRPIFQGAIYDPATTRTVNGQLVRDPFPGNRIPTTRFSQVARNVLALLPQPTRPDRFNNFDFNGTNSVRTYTYTVKLDHTLTNSQRLGGSYSRRLNRDGKCIRSLPEPLENCAWDQRFGTHYVRIAHDYTITTNVLNHINFGVNRTVSSNLSFSAGEGWAQRIGLAGAGGDLFPRFNLGEGIVALGSTQNALNIDNGYRFSDTLSWIKGAHSWKFGVDYREQRYTPTNQGANSGEFGFGRGQTAVSPTFSDRTGFGFASFLLGAVGGGSDKQSTNLLQWRSKYYALFAQDDWKARKNLVLNLGLRWDVDVPRRELHNRFSSFDPTLPNPAAGNRPGALAFANDSNERFADTWYKDFGPRIGFAWSPDRSEGFLGRLAGGAGKTVIRGGYGIYYQALIYADFGERLVAGFAGGVNFPSPNGYDPSFFLDQGVPQRNLPIGPTILNGSDIEYVAKDHGRPPMIQNWSLEVQRELAKDLILSVAYVGSNGHHLRSRLQNVNALPTQHLSLGNLLFANINSPEARAANIPIPYAGFNGSVFQALRPFPQYNFINTDCCLENLGNMNYNSLQAKLERRFSQGLNLLASYTFSKTITDSDSALPIFATFSGGGGPQNPYDRRNEKAISNQDIPHALVVSYIYELPIGEGKALAPSNKVVSKIVSGWQVGAVHRYQSGQPFSFCCAAGIPGQGDIRFNRVTGVDILTPQARSGNFDVINGTYFNRAAFANPNANRQPNQPFRFGTMSRTTAEVRSQPFFNEDFSIIKNTTICESVRLQFRTEMFNVLNRVVLRRPVTDVNAGDFGRIYGTGNNPRTIQFALKLIF